MSQAEDKAKESPNRPEKSSLSYYDKPNFELPNDMDSFTAQYDAYGIAWIVLDVAKMHDIQ